MRTKQQMKMFRVTNETDSEKFLCEGSSWNALANWMFERLDQNKKWHVEELEPKHD